MKAIVLGASGYAGMLLVRILARHPQIESVVAAARSAAGLPVAEADPGLSTGALDRIEPTIRDIEAALREPADVVFSALPHGASAEVVEPAIGRSVVIDLSADFRFRDEALYRRAYKAPRPVAAAQGNAVYGLSEWYRQAIASADVIGNPGCYPSAALTGTLPVVRGGYHNGTIVINALSGISGAGKKARTDSLFSERTENMNAYLPGLSHRHAPELVEQLNTEDLLFVPHLVPAKQGELATIVIPCREPAAAAQAIEERYRDEPFVRVRSGPVQTRHVRGTNTVQLGCHIEERHLIVFAAIDNLWKGAAGQAVQNMNIRFGFDERDGLMREAEL